MRCERQHLPAGIEHFPEGLQEEDALKWDTNYIQKNTVTSVYTTVLLL